MRVTNLDTQEAIPSKVFTKKPKHFILLSKENKDHQACLPQVVPQIHPQLFPICRQKTTPLRKSRIVSIL